MSVERDLIYPMLIGEALNALDMIAAMVDEEMRSQGG
jgi:hypothetical protein